MAWFSPEIKIKIDPEDWEKVNCQAGVWTFTSHLDEESDKEPEMTDLNCLPNCDTNAFDQTSNNLLGAHRRATHDIALELETIGDKIEQHHTAVMILERRRAYLLAQANEDVPMAQDQNATAPPYTGRQG